MPLTLPARYFEISSVPMCAYGAWWFDWTPLLQDADQRGGDVLIPYADGRTAKRRWRDATRHALPGTIWGEVDSAGAAHANGVTGVEANIKYLNDNVVAPVASSTGTRPATLYLPGGNRTANVHVIGLTLNRAGPDTVRAVLELSIPAGRFV